MKTKANVVGLIIFLLLTTLVGFGRDPIVILDSAKTEVLKADEITYYGIDFSKLHLVNPSKLHHAERIKNDFCPAWIKKFDRHFSGRRIKKMLSVKTLHDNRYPFQTFQYSKNDVNTIVSEKSSKLNIDSLILIVDHYQLRETNGIGVSIIVSEFNKALRWSTGFITFFDLESHNLLYVVEVHGKAGGKGMTDYWFESVYEIWAYFIDDTYTKERKKLKRSS